MMKCYTTYLSTKKYSNRFRFGGFGSLVLIAVLLGMTACYNPSKISFTNISSNYVNLAKNFNLSISGFTPDSSTCKVYFKFNSQALFFQKDIKKNYFFAKYKINYELYKSYDLKKLLDSATVNFIDSTHFNTTVEIFDSLSIPIHDHTFYTIAFTLTDLGKKYSTTKYLYVSSRQNLSRNSFLMVHENNVPFVESYINKGERFRIVCRDASIQKLYVKYFNRSFPIAEPPYTLSANRPMSFVADSVFTVTVSNGTTDMLSLNSQGIYHFQTDTSQKEGFSLYRFADDFPEITSLEQMLLPLHYITTKTEYLDLSSAKNTKVVMDAFWLEKAGNPDRARELIRTYYNRVQDANRYFTSYTDGWKTDRGIIYVIFGSPINVFRSASNETWYYGEDQNMISITLVFAKTWNPLTDNDYTLERGIEYKDLWYKAVQKWRQ